MFGVADGHAGTMGYVGYAGDPLRQLGAPAPYLGQPRQHVSPFAFGAAGLPHPSPPPRLPLWAPQANFAGGPVLPTGTAAAPCGGGALARPAGEAAAVAADGAGVARRLCKHGCGRPVQLGLTRMLQEYDTCCRSCALNPGAGIHDANCGGQALCSPEALAAIQSNGPAKRPRRLEVNVSQFVFRNEQPLDDVYELGAKLGEGSFGKVYRVEHRISGQQRVCKTISKASAGMPMEQILQEIENMAVLDHPNVVRVYEYFEDEKTISQIMEPCNGGELHDTIQDVFRRGAPRYSEAFVCDVMKQTLRALAFMHGRRFLHKDLKPQNIMRTDKETSSVKVIDFGLAELFGQDQKYASQVAGTLLYMAPECFQNRQSYKGDIWSAGVIMYNLLCGGYPFMAQWPPPEGKDENWWTAEVTKSICNDEPASNRILRSYSPECLQLMRQMLEKDQTKRPDASQCLSSRWFTRHEEPLRPLSVGVLQCLEAFSRQTELKKAVFLLMAHQCAYPVLLELRAIFTRFDVRNGGVLDPGDLRQVLQRSGLSTARADFILSTLDRDGDGVVSWTEFCAAALCVRFANDEPLMDAAFATFAMDDDERLDLDDFERVLAQGASAKQWRQTLPAELQSIGSKPPRQTGLAGLLEPCFPNRRESRTFVSQEDFRKFVGQRLTIKSGDALYRVS
eukprot:TRINITY_DN30893_c0_g1_i1.p1 TRINITY_DN30893_c0_g1~~TRINITY_DN30893_c0_g1_i1.p1  ORF type:complete len:678 (-),score=155.07 TRINITY_DN30893_c0_g1_i1:59-2092(-)